jgi:hypothetical protein
MVRVRHATCDTITAMRTSAIAVLFAASAIYSQSTGKSVLKRSFEVGNEKCLLDVDERTSPSSPTETKLSISCDNRTLFVDNLKDAQIGNVNFSSNDPYGHLRIEFNFGRGLIAGTKVIEVSTSSTGDSVRVIFDHQSRLGAEVFDQGDTILADVGRRFANATILPKATNVYRWKDGKYAFEGAFLWNKNANSADRYCILANPATCPAEKLVKPIPDDLS